MGQGGTEEALFQRQSSNMDSKTFCPFVEGILQIQGTPNANFNFLLLMTRSGPTLLRNLHEMDVRACLWGLGH